jgi:diguanylate cyclase (GGDEF)-like protein
VVDGQLTPESSAWQNLKLHLGESFSLELVLQRRAYDHQEPAKSQALQSRNAYRYILLGLAVLLAPVNAHNYYSGYVLPAMAGLSLLVLLIVNIWYLGQMGKPFLSPVTVTILTIALVFLSIIYGQSYSLYWLYPLLVALPILLRTRWAVWLGLLCAGLAAPIIFMRYDTTVALVITISMGQTWLVSAGLMYAITKQTRRLTDLANVDSLTGAYNRRYFESQAEFAFEHWQQTQRPSSYLLIDIDHFKQINDTCGHASGDLALQKLVELIIARVRKSDVVSRFGGEEFLVMLWETSLDGAMKTAEDLRKLVETSPILPGTELTVSIGVCDSSAANDVQHWFKLTDAALYIAKEKGRNRVEKPLVMPRQNPPIKSTSLN